MLFLALLPAKRKTARFAFRAAKLGLCPALRGLLFALGGQRLPGLCAHAGLRRLGAGARMARLKPGAFCAAGPSATAGPKRRLYQCVQRKAYTSAPEGSAPNVTLQTV